MQASLWLRRLWALALGCLLLAPSLKAANPFRDVPGDHWSLEAVRRLSDQGLIEGFPDGTFKGKKVVTRYDMAVHLAKLLARVDRIRAQGRRGLSNEDAVTLTQLTNEYKQELDLIGVKVDAFEVRLGKVEDSTKQLAKDLSNVRVEGLYRFNAFFVDEPPDFSRYPFSPFRNQFFRFRRSGDFPLQHGEVRGDERSGDTQEIRSGLQPMEHEVFLRFLGNPFALEGLNKKIETFLEIKGVLNGPISNKLQYRFSDPPIAGDNLDDFATGIRDDQRVSVNRAHMLVKSKRLDVRFFAEESMTDFDGPAHLFTSENLFGWAPTQGVEANGAYKKLTYRGAILKRQTLVGGDLGYNRNDLNEEFVPETVSSQDAFGLRFGYETHKAGVMNRLIFGTTYAEKVLDYQSANQFNRAIGFDVTWEHRCLAEIDASLVHVFTNGPGDTHDAGTIFDVSYERARWDIAGKWYDFGRMYRADMAQPPWVDAGGASNLNFRRPGGFLTRVAGEKLARTQIRYTADDTLFRNVDDLVFQFLFEQKWWEHDPDNPLDEDGNTARKVSLQTIADLTDQTHIELRTEYIKDWLENEQGELRNSINIDMPLWGETTLEADLSFIDDYDREDDNGDTFSSRTGRISLNSQVSDELFVQGYVETVKNEDRSRFSNLVNPNGRDANRVGGEATYSLDDDFSLKLFAEREEIQDVINPDDDGTFDRFAAEFNYNFTRALQFRYIRGFQDLDFIRIDDDFLINNFAELRYQPTEATEILLTYGFEYEAGSTAGFPSDRGPLNFYRTQNVLQLSAQTDF